MEQLRDIVIIVFGIGAFVATLALLLMGFRIYRKASSVLNSVRSAMNNIDAFSQGVLRPVARASNIASGISRVLSWLGDEGRKKRRG